MHMQHEYHCHLNVTQHQVSTCSTNRSESILAVTSYVVAPMTVAIEEQRSTSNSEQRS